MSTYLKDVHLESQKYLHLISAACFSIVAFCCIILVQRMLRTIVVAKLSCHRVRHVQYSIADDSLPYLRNEQQGISLHALLALGLDRQGPGVLLGQGLA